MTARAPGKIRIVAGTHRGRLLRVPVGDVVRPTAERVREAVFDVLGPVGGLRVLDLFAGTGAMGLEALSRGAAECVFVESDPHVASVLRDNVAALGYEGVCKVIQAQYEKAARSLATEGRGFGLLFVDPPYRILTEVEEILTPLLPSLLTDDGIAVIEGGKDSRAALGLTPVFDRTYGDTRVTMITMRRETP